jgi:hypothetical protein
LFEAVGASPIFHIFILLGLLKLLPQTLYPIMVARS